MTVIEVKAEDNVDDDRKLEERTKVIEEKPSRLSAQELERRRALVLGQFSFLDADDANKNVLDDNESLREVVDSWRASHKDERKRVRILYEAAPENAGEEKPRTIRRAKGYGSLTLPRVGETFVVVWVTSKGNVMIDRDIMLLSMKEVIATKEDQPELSGPRGAKFAFVERSSDENDGETIPTFDPDLFWSVGFLFKHFKTCGLMKWDKQLALLRREIQAKAAKESSSKTDGGRRRSGSGKYHGKLAGWKGTYGFIQCTSGDLSGKTIFLHHSDIVSPYLNLARGLPIRFDVVKENEDGQRLRAVKAQPCLCKFSCTVHESEATSKKSQPDQGRRRRRSSKSSGSGKLNSSDEAAPISSSETGSPADGNAGEGEKRVRGKKRRQFSRKQRKASAEVEA